MIDVSTVKISFLHLELFGVSSRDCGDGSDNSPLRIKFELQFFLEYTHWNSHLDEHWQLEFEIFSENDREKRVGLGVRRSDSSKKSFHCFLLTLLSKLSEHTQLDTGKRVWRMRLKLKHNLICIENLHECLAFVRLTGANSEPQNWEQWGNYGWESSIKKAIERRSPCHGYQQSLEGNPAHISLGFQFLFQLLVTISERFSSMYILHQELIHFKKPQISRISNQTRNR